MKTPFLETPPPSQKNIVAEAKEPQEAAEKESFDFRDPFKTFIPAPGETALQEVPAGPAETGQGAAAPEAATAYPALKVTGIVWGALDPKAIINDRVVGIGDMVEEAEVLNITREGILLKYKDKEFLMKRGSVGEPAKPKEVVP